MADEKTNQQRAEELRLLEAIANKTEEQKKRQKELIELQELANAKRKEFSATEKDTVQFLEKSVRFSKDNVEALQQQLNITEGKTNKERVIIEINEQKIRQQQIELEIAIKKGELTEEEIANRKKIINSLIDQVDNQKLAVAASERQVKTAERMVQHFATLGNQAKSFVNTLNSASGGMFPLAGVMDFSSALAKLGQASREAAEANANFTKVTGQSSAMMSGMKANLGGFGILYKDQAAAFGELYAEMSGFSQLNSSMQAEMANSAARMKNLGVDVGTTAKNYEELTKSLRYSASEAMDIQDDLAKVAIGAGIPPAKMLKEFAVVMPQLAGYGKQARDVFVNLEKQSKSLGIEIGTLTGIVGEGFDTFEGAADKAGKLNAILGGNYLNSVDMLNASEDERIEMMKRAMEMSGKSADSLGKYGQKAVASALGVKDLSTVNKLFGKSTSEMKDDMNSQAASQERLIAAQKAAGDVSAKLEAAMRELASVLQPIADFFRDLMKAFQDLSAEEQKTIVGFAIFTPMLGSLFSGIQSASGALGTFKNGFGMVRDLFKKTTPNIEELTDGIGDLANIQGEAADATEGLGDGLSEGAEGTRNMGEAAKVSWKEILAFGGAILLIGAGIGIASLGLAELVKSFSVLAGGQIVGAVTALVVVMGGFVALLYAMIPAITALGAAGSVVALPLLALGAAMFLLGAGVGIAAFGMSYLVESFSKLKGDQIFGAVAAIAALTITFGLLVAILIFAIPTTAVAGAAFAAAAPGFLALGAAMLLIGAGFALAMYGLSFLTEMAKNDNAGINLIKIAAGVLALTYAMGSMAAVGTGNKILSFFGAGSSGFAEQLREIIAVLNEVPDNIDVKISALKDVKETLSVAAQIDSEKIKPSLEFVKEIRGFYDAQTKAKQGEQDALMTVLKAIAGGNKDAKAGGKENEIPIMLKIEDAEPFRAAMSIKAGPALAQGKR